MELRTLRYFVAVAEELHFGRAARRLHISQPPLSQQIRKLEDELGVTLLERTQRRVALTHAGEVFLMRARSLVADAASSVQAAKRASRGEIGRLVIGFVHAAFYDLLPRILPRYRAARPDVELVLREMTNPEQMEALGERSIDVGFLRPPIAQPGLDVELLAREPFVAALPAAHRLAGGRRIHLSDLASEPLVMYPPSRSPLYGQIVDACLRAGFTPHVAQEAAYIDTLIGLVRAGIGIAIVPAAARVLRMPGLVYRSLAGIAARAETAMAWRTADTSPHLAAFLQSARARGRRNASALR